MQSSECFVRQSWSLVFSMAVKNHMETKNRFAFALDRCTQWVYLAVWAQICTHSRKHTHTPFLLGIHGPF